MRRLLIRPGAIGDCILSFPALESQRADYTEVWISRPLVRLVPFADRVRAIADTGLDRPEFGDALRDSLREFDSIISWHGSHSEAFREFAAGLGVPIQILPALPPPDAKVHATDFFLAQVGAAPGAVASLRLPDRINDGGFAAIHPFSGGRAKNWPLEHFRALAQLLRMPVRWTAGPQEQLADAERFDCLHDLACWLKGASLYVGNDSGVTHLAAAAGVPVVAVFQTSDPRVWAPRGPRVEIVEGAGVSEVHAACLRVLRATTGPKPRG